MLTAEELLAGSTATFDIDVPESVLNPQGAGAEGDGDGAAPRHVRLRPLTVGDLQLIARAAKDSDVLLGTLMVQRALVEPQLSVAQVAAAHVGLVQFLLEQVNAISGITATADDVRAAAQAPLAKAASVLAREFGWSPDQVSELTIGQVLLHLQLLAERPPA